MSAPVQIIGVGLLGPGLAGWPASAALLREPGGWQPAPTPLPPPARLPPAERRRSGAIVKLSLAVADEAIAMARSRCGIELDPGRLATVFTSSSGDPTNCHALCEALATPERAVSPTRFTNSVHNATAGYWHIATQSRAASTSLCAFDASWPSGLLEAYSQCATSQAPVLLVASDIQYPEPLHALRPMPDAFGIALVLAPAGMGDAGAGLTLAIAGEGARASMPDAGLDGLSRQVPAAHGLPLLQALAHGEPAELVSEGFTGAVLRLSVTPGGAW